MSKGRLEAFTDAVMAILITIMVLELHPPHGADLESLRPLVPSLLSYVLSFVYLGIYWNNHHHLMHTVHRATAGIMWANLHLLFWLSLIPFVTGWMGENRFAPLPTAAYGLVLLCAAIAYRILQTVIVADRDANARLRGAIGPDVKGKLSVAMYAAGVALAFASRWTAIGLYVAVALMWLVPDRRIERRLASPPGPSIE